MEDILNRWKEYGESLFQDHCVQGIEVTNTGKRPSKPVEESQRYFERT